MLQRLIIFFFGLCLTIETSNAQKSGLRGRRLESVPIVANSQESPVQHGKQVPLKNRTSKTTTAGLFGTQIGHTYYDLQTNGASGNRILHHPDGTISAVWNEVCNPNTSAIFYPERGAGYNYFNGTTWIHGSTGPGSGIFNGTCNEPPGINGPAFGVASKRVGWPEIIGLRNGKELIFTHNGSGINVTSRPTKGTGGMAAWSTTNDLAFSQNVINPYYYGSWPRVVNSGDTIHMVYALYKDVSGISMPPQPVINGVTQPLVYCRSVDGGLTWDKQNIFLPGMVGIRNQPFAPINPEGFEQIGPDNYAIAVKGGTVAIVAAHLGNPWTLWKSTNNGTTFTRRVISKVTPADTTIINNGADTVAFVNDNNHAIIIDNNNVVHVWAGELLAAVSTHNGGTVFTPGLKYYPNEGKHLLYWNDAMPNGAKPIVIAGIENSQPLGSALNFVANSDGGMKWPYYETGLVSMPTAALDANNNIYLVYSAAVKGTSNNGNATGQPYRDLYHMRRYFGTWEAPINISRTLNLFPNFPSSSAAENYQESVFPSLTHMVGSNHLIYLLFQSDDEPGTRVGTDSDPETENAIISFSWNINNYPIYSTSKTLPEFNILQINPNPTKGQTKLSLELVKQTHISVSVKNIIGREVARIPITYLPVGPHQLSLDLTNFANGVYLYTVTSDKFTLTNRIVKQ